MFKPITNRYYLSHKEFKNYFEFGKIIKVYKEDTRIIIYKELEHSQEEVYFNILELLNNNVIKLITDPYIPIISFMVLWRVVHYYSFLFYNIYRQ